MLLNVSELLVVENKGRNRFRWLTPNLRLQITRKIPENDVLWGSTA